MTEKILVVEDNPYNLQLATDLLEAKGFRVVHARTAEDGLCLARQDAPDLVLMDLSLPGMDGLAATQVLRADPRTRHLVVIALTAHAMKGDEEIALRAGCDGYLSKPINTRTFTDTIREFLPLANMRKISQRTA
jgi:CheY-like chemotaxis protein